MSSLCTVQKAGDWKLRVTFLLVALVTVLGATGLSLLLNSRPLHSEAKASNTFHKWTSADAFNAFRAAGLSFEISPLPKDERDAFSNMMVVESKPFQIPGQGADAKGIIQSFDNQRDVRRMQEYYAALSSALPQYSSWVFVQDNLVLQVNRSVPEPVAKRYAAALDKLSAW